MASTVTLAQLRTKIREQADEPDQGSDALNFIKNSELNSLINQGIAKHYNILVQSGHLYFESSTNITGTGATRYNLPSDFAFPIAVYRVDGTSYRPLREIMAHEWHLYASQSASNADGYRIVNSQIELLPAPSSGTYKVSYIPAATKLVNDGDTMDGVSGWEDIVVSYCVMKIRTKDKTQTYPVDQEYMMLKNELAEQAELRNFGSVQRVVDVNDARLRDPADWDY